jgi:hypothetical protein
MTFLSALVVCALIAGVLLFIEVGRRIGLWRRARVPHDAQILSSTVEASVFGLMGLLIAFTFYGAGERFDRRRSLIAEEANAIGTAYLRLDLLPMEVQPLLREDFRKYLSSRLDVYRAIPDINAATTALDRSSVLQRTVWKEAIEAAKGSGPAEKTLLLTSLNAMIDITTVRTVALMTHPPAAIFVLLGLTVIASSILAGYEMSARENRDWMSILIFALVLGAALYLILDYEFPRVGLVRIDPMDQVLIDTLEKMK